MSEDKYVGVFKRYTYEQGEEVISKGVLISDKGLDFARNLFDYDSDRTDDEAIAVDEAIESMEFERIRSGSHCITEFDYVEDMTEEEITEWKVSQAKLFIENAKIDDDITPVDYTANLTKDIIECLDNYPCDEWQNNDDTTWIKKAMVENILSLINTKSIIVLKPLGIDDLINV